MRAVAQRVLSASVTVDGELVSSISRGLMVLVGIGKDDTPTDVETICNKLLSLRMFEDQSGAMWRKSVKEIDGEVLCVSQFTLLANTTKGNKPDFHNAMGAEPGYQLYTSFLDRIRTLYKPGKIKDGRFGAMMNVSLTNEGPVTFTIDSRKFEYVAPQETGSGGKAAKSKQIQGQPSGSQTAEQVMMVVEDS